MRTTCIFATAPLGTSSTQNGTRHWAFGQPEALVTVTAISPLVYPTRATAHTRIVHASTLATASTTVSVPTVTKVTEIWTSRCDELDQHTVPAGVHWKDAVMKVLTHPSVCLCRTARRMSTSALVTRARTAQFAQRWQTLPFSTRVPAPPDSMVSTVTSISTSAQPLPAHMARAQTGSMATPVYATLVGAAKTVLWT